MVAPVDSQLPKLHPFRPLDTSLPCDIHLLNLRTLEDTQVSTHQRKHKEKMFHISGFIAITDQPAGSTMKKIWPFLSLFDKQEAGSPSQEVALLLHRKGFDCSAAPQPPLQCTWSSQEEVIKIDLWIFLKQLLFFKLYVCTSCSVAWLSVLILTFFLLSLLFFFYQVNLEDLFSPFKFSSLRQSGLTLLRDDVKTESARQQQPQLIAPLRPMEISAFRAELQWWEWTRFWTR